MNTTSISDSMAGQSTSTQRFFLFLRATGVLLAVILSISTWLLMTVSLGSKKALDDFGQTASLPMTFLHHAGALAFVPVFVALLVSAGCFLNPRCSVRTLAVGACLLAGAAVVLAAVMAVIVLEFSKLIADLR